MLKITVLLILAGYSQVIADQYVVTSTGDVTDASDGVLTLREALVAANATGPADEIIFSDGSGGTVNFHDASNPKTIQLLSDALPVSSELTITGPGSDFLTIDGGSDGDFTVTAGEFQIFRVDNFNAVITRDVTIAGLTLANAISPATGSYRDGGAISSREHLTLADIVIRDCRSGADGGAIGCSAVGIMSAADCSFLNNHAVGNGGAIQVESNGGIDLSDCHLEGNVAENGGAIYSSAFAPIGLRRCRLDSNTALTDGGAVFVLGLKATIISSRFNENSAVDGGACRVAVNKSLDLVSCTLDENTASGDGGGVFSDGLTQVLNSLFIGNEASSGGAIYQRNSSIAIGHSTLIQNSASTRGGGLCTNLNGPQFFFSVIAGNTAGGLPSELSLSGSNPNAQAEFSFIGDPASAGGITDGSNDNIVGQDDGSGGRVLLPVADVYFSDPGGDAILTEFNAFTLVATPLGTSVIIDAGDTSVTVFDEWDIDEDGDDAEPLPNDQRGAAFARQVGARFDIGCTEQSVSDLFTVTTTSSEGLGSLRAAIENANVDSSTADVIVFSDGTNGSHDFTTGFNVIPLGDSTLTIAGPVEVRGFPFAVYLAGNSNGDQIADPGESRIFTVDDRTGISHDVILRDMTLFGGFSGDGTPANSNLDLGGAVYNKENLTIVNVTLFSNGSERRGGAIYNDGTLGLLNCTVSQNNSKVGGAIFNADTFYATNTSFTDNVATGRGGGINNAGVMPLAINLTIAYNTALEGGGIFNGSGNNILIHNSVIAGNELATGTASDVEGDSLDSLSSYNLIANSATAGGLTDNTNNNLVGNAGAGILDIETIFRPGTIFNAANGPTVDSGDNSKMPADFFDVDFDGDTAEPIPLTTGFANRFDALGIDRGSTESTDNDDDGLTNLWEMQYEGGDPTAIDPDSDQDGDGLKAHFEFGAGSDPTERSPEAVPVLDAIEIDGDQYLTISYQTSSAATLSNQMFAERSTDFELWLESTVLVSRIDAGGGISLITERSPFPMDGQDLEFLRVTVKKNGD